MKILIIEDELDLVEAIKKGFVNRGFIVDYALDGEEGLELYYINDYDLIILDLNLPIMDGLEVVCGDLKVDTLSKTVYIKDNIIALAPREYSIVEYLILNKGRVISSEDLIEHVWSSDVNLFTDSVKVHISNIRKKFRTFGDCEYINTVRGQGYLIYEGDNQ